ncbi:hypothetical protein DFR28_10645 [Arenicella xantha]|uniref:Uncharacterized protein n=1 Tax=Arenicella xantha TaxID=644221 RepID=A0A395JFQ3_9GAMM|nr:hypothetical protein DFR28_10645 [Arenicella xantha]
MDQLDQDAYTAIEIYLGRNWKGHPTLERLT